MSRRAISRRDKLFGLVTGATPLSAVGALAVGVSCLAGFALSFSGFKLRETVSATTFTFVGVVCKFATILVNQVIWVHHGSPIGAVVLCASILLSTIYVAPKKRAVDDGVAKDSAEVSKLVDDPDSSSYGRGGSGMAVCGMSLDWCPGAYLLAPRRRPSFALDDVVAREDASQGSQ